MSDKDITELRKSARMRDERRNERLTRGEILDAIDTALFGFDNPLDTVPRKTLYALREAFE